MANINEKDWQQTVRVANAQMASQMSQQQQLLRLIQYLNLGQMDKAGIALDRGLPVDLMLLREANGGPPGASYFFTEIEATLGCPIEWLTPLIIFARANQTEQVAWLLARDAMPNMIIDNGYDAAWVAMKAKALDAYDLLMEAGSSPGQRLTDGTRTTRLMEATVLRQVSVVSDLLARDADPNAYNAKGQLALHLSLTQNPYSQDDLEITRLLLYAGSIPDFDDNNKVSPMDLMTSPEHVALLRGARAEALGPAPTPQPTAEPSPATPTVDPVEPTSPAPRGPRPRPRV